MDSAPTYLAAILPDEISTFSKVILVLGKVRSHTEPNLGCRGVELPGWFAVSLKISAQDMMQEQVCCHNEAANHQLPIAEAFGITWTVSAEECSSFTQSCMEICCSTHSIILKAIVTQYTCSLNGIYCPHWLVQWNHHYSPMCIPIHSLWLPGYINVSQTIFVILTMVGHLPDRLCITWLT